MKVNWILDISLKQAYILQTEGLSAVAMTFSQFHTHVPL